MIRKDNGFSLIEILITLVILSFGLMGLAFLQINAMQLNHGAYLRTQIEVLTYDMVDRLRANRTEAMSSANYQLTLSTEPPTPSINCNTANCSESQMAEFDLYEWREYLSNNLPQGKGAISYVVMADGGRLYTIDIKWLANRSVTVTDSSSFSSRFETFSFKTDL